ncbi:MAG: YnbE family lipoprotein [Sphingomonas sp.]
MKWMVTIGLGALGLGMSGCINVTAPDKPIVINLNINVTQEVVVRLDQDAKDLIKSKPGIF